MSEYILEMRDVSKSFPGVKALDHVQLKLRPGKVHALMGENGAGKSTLMKCMFGIYKMDEGQIYIDGQPIVETYINDLTFNKLDFIGPKTVPEGCVFVMGDNRNASIDSRKKEIGMLDTRLILGRAYYVIYPLSALRVIH